MVIDIVDQAVLQSSTINCLLERLIERRELIQLYVNKIEEVSTYADAATKSRLGKGAFHAKGKKLLLH